MYNKTNYPYPSYRRSVHSRKGMVATTQPLAAQAGLDILKKGGNAVDAAIATAICLTVLEPVSNGVGGDSFALVWMEDHLYGLNASGGAPQSLTIEKLKARGITKMPQRGVLPIMVPGTPASWVALSKRFGRLSLRELADAAICYAREGYPVSPAICNYWNRSILSSKTELAGAEFDGWRETFSLGGRPLTPGQIVHLPELGETLEQIADTAGESFYRGALAHKIAHFVAEQGGELSFEDLAAYQPEWVEPLSLNYRGYDVWELPPNGQGLVTLETLNILKNRKFSESDLTQRLHAQFEAIKMSFDDGLANITDPRYMSVSPEVFLDDRYGRKLMEQITPDSVYEPKMTPLTGGTVYLSTADKDGNMVSFIQSTFEDFGSGVVVPNTGIVLQNRGSSFQLDSSCPNALAPGRKSYHTIIPGFLTQNGRAVGAFGVMGAFMQPQGHVQVLMNTIDFHLNPQAALDAPRWQWMGGLKFQVEPGIPEEVVCNLRKIGHDVSVNPDLYSFGRGQIIWRDQDSGVLEGGTDSRSDGVVAAW